ncbi:MAG: hypothetical protein J2P53_12580 [Bradyrhizobiaceae bacterium]|nr:hypothetical protein [Bradyrhizobiaceae bacterium]
MTARRCHPDVLKLWCSRCRAPVCRECRRGPTAEPPQHI